MTERLEDLSTKEIILRLERLIRYFESTKSKPHNEEELPDSFIP